MKIKLCYFSPTGATRQVASRLAQLLADKLDAEVVYHSYTLPRERVTMPEFENGDLVLWATPVYAGRIPNKTLDYVRSALVNPKNKDLPAVALVSFGNRAYDNALAELTALMQDGGMHPVGAAAVVTRHCFSETLGAGRPDAEDLAALERFASEVAETVKTGRHIPVKVPGEAHPERYYTPLKANHTPAGFLKAKPSCDTTLCTRCGRCAEVCPMGSILSDEGLPRFEGICIKCQACRLTCPKHAIAFTDPDYHSHVSMIERSFAAPKPSEFFIGDKATVPHKPLWHS